VRAGIDCRALAPESGGIGAFSRSALESLARYGGGRKFLAVFPKGMAERVKLPADFAVASAEDMLLWGEMQLPYLLEEFGAEVFYSPLFACPVVRSARNVVTLHDVFPESHPELCTPEFMAFWKSRLGPSLRSACHAVAVSEWSKAQAVERLKLAPGRVSVVRQSVGDRFRPVGRSEADPVLARHGLRFGLYTLYVGAIDPRKNLERLVRAFGLLKSSELTLAIAGQPASKGYSLDGIIRGTGLGDRVKLLGHVADADLPAFYSGARCFAFPSLAEGFGRPCIEAMGCGVPVVASSATALPETCGDAALLPAPESEGAIAEALQTACFDDEARARLVAAGTKRAAEFSSERMASDLLTAFDAALAGPREGLWPA
jgi:alpha-1,3-rhamnosyl/mannosyltransferase